MVEAAGVAVVDVAVGMLDLGHLESILPAQVMQGADRVFHRIGVEVTQQHGVLGSGTGRVGLQPGMQLLRRGHAGRVPAALVVIAVGVGTGGVAAALRLEVVGDHHERRTLLALEGLRQRHAAVLDERATVPSARRHRRPAR
ncbi:hypothetical protein WR25_18004 [Diploscapter pachys]|uniref:Uncharacterized protein n=1 Tax=Diploscapter pachys TaxID=2018661 RepID=A0A2A2KM80_9BILA|nr:hypothetical protein WR25_18004 [Diploscapter pachys]